MEKRHKIERILNVLSGRVPVDELLPPRFKVRVGYADGGTHFINDKPVSEQEFNARFIASEKANHDPLNIKVTTIKYEGSDSDD